MWTYQHILTRATFFIFSGCWCLVVVVMGTTTTLTKPKCKLSELECNNGRCISLNRFCDGVNHCGDMTDEPPKCTPCNRTYYGEVGLTYDLELHRPRVDKLPYHCHLILSAGGGHFGDIVQVNFERFTVGRFTSFIREGCPDGWLTINEKSRSQVGGVWCGSYSEPVLYFSETTSLTLALTLLTLPTGQNSFDFKITYKMLHRSEAVVRFGHAPRGLPTDSIFLEDTSDLSNLTYLTSQEYFLGNRIGETYCSRMFSECDRKECRLQSPNFPGVYPRNLTCYYAVRQQNVPRGKHALISVSQPEPALTNIRSQAALYARPTTPTQQFNNTLKIWGDCDEVQDYVTIYDGYTTRDPVLLKFCGGGTAVPRTVSSGPEILVEFATSPFGTFRYPPPPQNLHGFQLQVNVEFVEQDAAVYTRNKRCEFWISGTGPGVLESPKNTLPPNTTCLYHLWGAEPGSTPPPRPHPKPQRYRIWLSVLKYHVAELLPNNTADTPCSTSLKIWDGSIKTSITCANQQCDKRLVGVGGRQPANLIAHYCKDQIPKSCDHQLLFNTSRPCSPPESILTSGDTSTLELTVSEATSLKPVYFKVLYEFVDLHQDGQPDGHEPCSRLFTSKEHPSPSYYSTHHFASPRNIFLYGRGGRPNISCTYRFEAQEGERIRITLTNLRMGNRTECTTVATVGGRVECVGRLDARLRFMELAELASGGRSRLPKDCLCSRAESVLPFVYTSVSRALTLSFVVENMTFQDDYRSFGFEATWEFIKRPVCPMRQTLSGPSGVLTFTSPSKSQTETNCERKPWVIEPSDSHYLYVKITGIVVGGSGHRTPEEKCATTNRVEIHAGLQHFIICPQPIPSHASNVVEVFSEGWVIIDAVDRLPPGWSRHHIKETRNIVVEFSPREAGSYTITWLELTRRRSEVGGLTGDCPYRCPELDGCINGTLWCDSVNHCPSGYDESLAHCLPLPPIQLALLAIIILSGSSLVITLLCRLRKPKHSRSLKSLPSDTDTIVSSTGKVC